MRRLISVLLVVIALVNVTPVFADELGIGSEADANGLQMLQYSYTNLITASLGISSGVATCGGRVSASDNNNKVSVSMTLYRSSGSSWVSIATWTGSGTGIAGATASGTKTVTAGYNYKVIVTGTVKDPNGKVLETTTRESAIKSY